MRREVRFIKYVVQVGMVSLVRRVTSHFFACTRFEEEPHRISSCLFASTCFEKEEHV